MDRRFLLLFPALPLLVWACVSDPMMMMGDGGGNDVATQDGMIPPAGCPLGCLPPAPMGWVGPSAIYDGPSNGKPTMCPKVYIQKELEAHQGATAGPANCGCSGVLSGATCSAVVSTYGTSSTCAGFGILQGTVTMPGSCLALQNSGYTFLDTPVMDSGTCTIMGGKSVPDASFTAENVSCGLPQNAVCTMDPRCVATPVPDAPFTRLCIHHDGDMMCPSADYTKRFVAFKTFTDTRDCTPCAGGPSGGSCGTKWGSNGSNLGTCANNPPTNHNVGTCSNVQYGINAAVGGAIAPTGITCATDGGTPTGVTASAAPVTFCCNK